MKLKDAVSVVNRHLGFRDDLDEFITSELRLAQERLERADLMPWFLVSEMGKTTTKVEEERVKVPPNFLREYHEGSLWRVDGTRLVELKKGFHDRLVSAHTAFGAPKRYALVGDYFLLRPVPDTVYEIRTRFFLQDTILSGPEVENKWLKYAPYMLIGDAGAIMATALRDKEAVAVFQAMFADARRRLSVDGVEREMANLHESVGSGEDFIDDTGGF